MASPEKQDQVGTPVKAQEPSTPSTTGSRRSSTQLQPLRPTRLFQLGASSTSNSASASTQSSRHASIIPSPGSVQIVQPCGNYSLPNLREMEQCAERSENHTPIASTEPSVYRVTGSTHDAMMPLMGPIDRAVQSFHDLRLTNDWEAPSLMPASVERREAESLIRDRDTPKAQASKSLLPGFQYASHFMDEAAIARSSNHHHDSRLGDRNDAQFPSRIVNAPMQSVQRTLMDHGTVIEAPYDVAPGALNACSRWPNPNNYSPLIPRRPPYAHSELVHALPKGAYQAANDILGHTSQSTRQGALESLSNNINGLQGPTDLDSLNGRGETHPASRGRIETGDPGSQHLRSSHIGGYEADPTSSSNLLSTTSGPLQSSSAISSTDSAKAGGLGSDSSSGGNHNHMSGQQTGRNSHSWEGSVFDQKWLSQPTDVWSLEARRHSSHSDMSPKHGDGPGNNVPTADHITFNELREQEADTASMTGSTISTQVSSIFDTTPYPHQSHQQVHLGQYAQVPDETNHNAAHPLPYAGLHELQGSAFDYQLGQVQAANPSQATRLAPFHHQPPVARGRHPEPSRAQAHLNHLQQISPTFTANYYGGHYAVSGVSPLAIHNPSMYGFPAPQALASSMEPQYLRPTLPPSGRRQATLANYERIKAEELATQNAEMALTNMQMQHALGGLHLPVHSYDPVAPVQHGAFQYAKGVQYNHLLPPSMATDIHAPAPVPIDRSQFNSHFETDPSIYTNLVPNAYHRGSDLMYPQSSNSPSDKYHHLLRNGTPVLTEAFSTDNIPITTSIATHQGTSYGVVRLGNIPYTLTVPAVYALLGSNARVLTPDFGPAIHIMMDRSSGKTGNECFVEFFSVADAEIFVNKMQSTSSTVPFSSPSTPLSEMPNQRQSPCRHRHTHSSSSYGGSRFATPTPSQRGARSIGYNQQVRDSGYGSPQSYASFQENRSTETTGPRGIHKLGDRTIFIEMSTQDAFLTTLYPKAKNIDWINGEPVVKAASEAYNSGFKTFVTKEELVLLVKYAEAPQKSQYTTRSPQRPYQSMISTLAKFPWASPHLVTIQSRNDLYEATRALVRTLVNYLKHHSPEHAHPLFYYAAHPISSPSSVSRARSSTVSSRGSNPSRPTNHITSPHLDPQLLADLVSAGINAAGFSETQRWELVMASELMAKNPVVDNFMIKSIGCRISPLAMVWPFEVLQRKRGADEDVVEFYAKVLGASRHSDVATTSGIVNRNPFGAYVGPQGSGNVSMTLADAGNVEWDHFLNSIATVLR